MRILYQEHEFGPNLLWGLGPVQNVFPMRFYRRWRQFKQQVVRQKTSNATRGPPTTTPEYLAINKVEGPPLPRCNRAISNIYPPLPAKSSSSYSNNPRVMYATHDHQMTTTEPPVQQTAARAAPRRTSLHLNDPQPETCAKCPNISGRFRR